MQFDDDITLLGRAASLARGCAIAVLGIGFIWSSALSLKVHEEVLPAVSSLAAAAAWPLRAFRAGPAD